MKDEKTIEKDERKPIIFMQGKKTILRPLDTKQDASTLQRWINDPEIRQFVMNNHPLILEDEQTWIQSLSRSNPNNIVVGIEALTEKESYTFIGTMGIHKIDFIHGTATTGALIGEKTFWGKGYGQDAKMQLLAHAFLALNLRKINSSAKAFNERSVNYNKACGYQVEGVRKKQMYHNGEYIDEVLLAVFKEDWLPLWETYNKN